MAKTQIDIAGRYSEFGDSLAGNELRYQFSYLKCNSDSQCYSHLNHLKPQDIIYVELKIKKTLVDQPHIINTKKLVLAVVSPYL